jgi:hypothetical protein
MNTSKTLAALIIFASVATVALAKGPGHGSGTCATPGTCAGSGKAAGSADAASVGSMKRSQTRDPATNPTGTPLQTRIHAQTPVVARELVPVAPTVMPIN